MGGDEFVVIASGLGADASGKRAEQMRSLARHAGQEVCNEQILSLSVGRAVFPDDGNDAEQLLSEADRRMLVPFTTFWARFASRIALLPIIAGVSYEIIRFAAKHRGSLFALMTAPGLWLQRITTKPPSDDQALCAITALDQAMALEKERGGELVIA